jgi:hypothetical protein
VYLRCGYHHHVPRYNVTKMRGAGSDALQSRASSLVDSFGSDEFVCFLSHHRGSAQGEARFLHTELSKALNIDKSKIFIDVDKLQDLAKLLREHVCMTRVLILLQTKEVLTRPFVLAEIYTALMEGIAVLCVDLYKGYNFQEASKLLGARNFPDLIEAANPGTLDVLRRQGIDAAEMGRVLNERIPSLVSLKLDITWDTELRDASVGVVAKRILEDAERVQPRIKRVAPASEAERAASMTMKLVQLGVEREEAVVFSPRLVREGFTVDNLQLLISPPDLTRLGIIKPAHVAAILGKAKMNEIHDGEAARKLAEERAAIKVERERLEAVKAAAEAATEAAQAEMALERARAAREVANIEARHRAILEAKQAAQEALLAANDADRRALIEKAERITREDEINAEVARAKRDEEERLHAAALQSRAKANETARVLGGTSTLQGQFVVPGAAPVMEDMQRDDLPPAWDWKAELGPRVPCCWCFNDKDAMVATYRCPSLEVCVPCLVIVTCLCVPFCCCDLCLLCCGDCCCCATKTYHAADPRYILKRTTFALHNMATMIGVSGMGPRYEYSGRFVGKYEGNVNSIGFKDRRGQFFWLNGDRYTGEWQVDHMEGRGTFIWADGRRYEGEWKSDQKHGLGKMFNAQGRLEREGRWARDEPVATDFVDPLDAIERQMNESAARADNAVSKGIPQNSIVLV